MIIELFTCLHSYTDRQFTKQNKLILVLLTFRSRAINCWQVSSFCW